jgi:hypothetical protein
MSSKLLLGILAGLAVCGCSQTPPVKLRHFLPRTETAVTVTQVVTCNNELEIVSAASITTATTYAANTRDPQVIDMTGYGSSLANTGLTFTYYDDGRLMGIDATSTGKGGEIVKSAIGLMTTLAGRSGPPLVGTSQPVACANIKKWGKGEPVTLTYNGVIAFTDSGSARPYLRAEPASHARYEALKNAIGYICPVVSFPQTEDLDLFVEPTEGAGRVPLRQPVDVQLQLFVNRSDTCVEAEREYQILDDTVLASEAGKIYMVPIPKPAAFGKQTFALTLAESGALTKIQYDTEPGTDQALDAAKEVAAAAIETDAEITARATAEMTRIKTLNALV